MIKKTFRNGMQINLSTTIFLIVTFFNSVASLLVATAQPIEFTSLIRDGKYEEAVSELKKQSKQTKDVEQLSLIYNQIGEIQFEHLHDYHVALETYQSIVELSKKGLSKYEVMLSLMKIGDLYCRISKYDRAIQTYERLIKDYPQTTISTRVVHRKIQNIETALSKLDAQERIIRNNPETTAAVQAFFQIAELLRTSLNSPEAAITRYVKLSEKYPHSSIAPEAQWRIGYVYDRVLNSKSKAIKAYKDVVENYPTSHFAAEALFRLGRIYEGQGNYGQALEVFDELIQQCPDFWKFPAVFYWKGKCLEALKDYAQAIDAYKVFLIVYLPQTDQARLGDIGKYKQNKLKIEAEIESKIIALQADMPKVEWEKAQALIEKGNYLEALPSYRKLPRIAPNSQWAQDAKKQIRMIEYKAGIQRLRKIIRSLPGSHHAMIAQERIGEIYERELKDYDRAIEEYDRVLSNLYARNSLSALALYRIGTIYAIKTKKLDEATKIYNQLIKEFPHSSEAAMASYQLAEVYNSAGKYKEAIFAYKNVLKSPSRTHYIGNGYTDSFADRAQFQIGRVFYQNLRNFNSAEKAFNEFVEERPDSPRLAAAYVFLGMLSEEQKKNGKETVKHLQKAIDLVLSNGSIQSEMIINEIPTISFPDKEPMTVLKYLKDKINSFNR